MKRIIPAGALKASNTKEESSSMPNPEVVESPDMMMHLRKYQASLMVASTMIKSFHYCVYGMGYYTIHPKLGEFWDELDEIIDEVAELTVMLGGVPIITMKEALEMSPMAEYNFNGRISCKQAMTQVEVVFGSLYGMSRTIASTFDEAGDVGNAGIIGEHSNYYTKSNWMVKSYLKS